MITAAARARIQTKDISTIRLSELVSALSFALDLTEGQTPGHAIRCCLIAMRIGRELELDDELLSSLYYATLLKDIGCSSNAARMCQIMQGDDLRSKREVKTEDWTRPSLTGLKFLWRNVAPDASIGRKVWQIAKIGANQQRNNRELITARCDRGASIVRKIGLSDETARAIRALDEHWNGGSYPDGLKGEHIPLLARIMSIAQNLDVFAAERGPAGAQEVLETRSGRWFDPELVRLCRSFTDEDVFWRTLLPNDAEQMVVEMEPGISLEANPERIDLVCEAFADVVDAKSSFTYTHSIGVTDAACSIANELCISAAKKTLVRRAALLHDIGKLSVPNTILDKPGKLTDEEFAVIKQHPVHTKSILQRISGFEDLAYVAGAHHEKLDGTGYPEKLGAGDLTQEARIIAVADIWGALTEQRPYRAQMASEEALAIIRRDVPRKLDRVCFEALEASVMHSV